MSKITEFLDDVCSYIRCKMIHDDIRYELSNHIYDLKDLYIEKGYDEEKAIDMAIASMGDSCEIGKNLNKEHRYKTEWSLIGLASVIVLIGSIIMYMSSKAQLLEQISIERYFLFVVFGIGVMIGIYYFNYIKLKKLAWPIYIVSTLSIFTIFKGNRFFPIGSISISSDFITLFYIIAFVGFLEKDRNKGTFATLKLMAITFASMFFIGSINRNTSQIFILLIACSILIFHAVFKNHFGGSKKQQIGILACVYGCIISFLVIRISESKIIPLFLSRGKTDPLNAGWMQVTLDKWLAISQLFGKTVEKVEGNDFGLRMPGVASEFVLVNIIANLGWVVGIALVLVIILFIIRMLITTRKVKNNFGFYLSFSACIVLSVEFIINILTNFNLFPMLMSINMPFVSYGGTSYVVNMAFLGIILSVFRVDNLIGRMPKGDKELIKY